MNNHTAGIITTPDGTVYQCRCGFNGDRIDYSEHVSAVARGVCGLCWGRGEYDDGGPAWRVPCPYCAKRELIQ